MTSYALYNKALATHAEATLAYEASLASPPPPPLSAQAQAQAPAPAATDADADAMSASSGSDTDAVALAAVGALREECFVAYKRHDEQIAAVMSQLNTLGSAISSVMARLDALLPSATASGPPTQGRVADLVAAFGGAAIAPTGVAAALRQ